MIKENKTRRAIKIVQDLIIVARNFGYEDKEPNYIAKFLDRVELLPGLILEEKDRTDLFEQCVRDICDIYGCEEVINRNKLDVLQKSGFKF
ncbi:MAG TPA: hypothetical protein PKY82_17420 [Pyrinomonadaceae bacterium]|nr:hypothetical protein [Pyrinomonadaceae bacterium]